MIDTGFRAAEILLPDNVDMTKWACIACDQFTSDFSYWEKLDDIVGFSKSTLKLTLPEIYLDDDAEDRIKKINGNINDYLADGTFKKLPKGYILTVRSTPYKQRRIGIVACVDLEDYDYSANAKPLVRATEGTIEERIPPRLKIRKNAKIELPHIMILFDDEKKEIAEKLFEKRESYKKIYDFDLNMNGGHVTGYYIPESENLEEKFSALADPERLNKKYGTSDLFTFAVGDGNHSLATAKAHWNAVKATLKGEALKNHPARYALAEFVNIYDEGIYFEPIFRFIKGINPNEFINGLKAKVKGDYAALSEKEEKVVKSNITLPETLKNIDGYIKEYIAKHGGKVDYIHGKENLKNLIKNNADSVGIITDGIKKEDLFKFVSKSGALPRKTFSMGEGIEKRYYLEAKFITDTTSEGE